MTIMAENKKQKLVVDQDLCIACGTCVALCPEVFELKDDGKAIVKTRLPVFDAKLKTKIKDTIESCAVEAISWEDEE